jgi:predicted DCC family thiol-disulfide oxidoreductase YuxK|tara:strand:+ start:265 stop:678 length:414 start_codon:yes stop_codon:yes gene_type:complete
MSISKENSKVILFDGVCNLCNNSVKFIIKNDKRDIFKFAPLQSEYGINVQNRHNINTNEINSIILINGEKIFTKSNAALRIAKDLGAPYFIFYIFIVIPVFIRNFIYDFIAKNRYKWFGKMESCMIPSNELKNKFFD